MTTRFPWVPPLFEVFVLVPGKIMCRECQWEYQLRGLEVMDSVVLMLLEHRHGAPRTDQGPQTPSTGTASS